MGLHVTVSLGILAIYYILSLACTRMRAQFGSPLHDLHFTGPDAVLTSVFGTRAFLPQDLVGLALQSWYSNIYRSNPMPHQMEAFKMQQQTGGSNRGVVAALTVAAFLGSLATMWSFVHIYYVRGVQAKGGGFNTWLFPKLESWLISPQGPQWGFIAAIGVGLVVAFLLQFMRMQYVNWPFHPLGFAIAGNYQMNHAWLPLLIAWLVKLIITKYWGYQAYRRSVNVFLGFILADFVVISVLNLVGIILNIPVFRFVD
jgi:hypothetical protein